MLFQFFFFSPPKKETGLSSSRALASCLGVISRTKETSGSVEEKWSGVNKTHTHKNQTYLGESAFSENNSDTGCLLLDIASARLRVSSGLLFFFLEGAWEEVIKTFRAFIFFWPRHSPLLRRWFPLWSPSSYTYYLPTPSSRLPRGKKIKHTRTH